MQSSPQQVQPPGTDAARAFLRHLVATLAYRAAKVLRDAPESFGDFALTPSTRRPAHIVAHMGDLMDWALHFANGGYVWQPVGSRGWHDDVSRFFAALSALDARLASPEPLGYPAETIIQGPLADALTHVGPLAMLRGAAGYPVKPESYARAEIAAGQVGLEQPAARREFDGDASFPSAST